MGDPSLSSIDFMSKADMYGRAHLVQFAARGTSAAVVLLAAVVPQLQVSVVANVCPGDTGAAAGQERERRPQPCLMPGVNICPGHLAVTSWLQNAGRLWRIVADPAMSGSRGKGEQPFVGACCGQIRGQATSSAGRRLVP